MVGQGADRSLFLAIVYTSHSTYFFTVFKVIFINANYDELPLLLLLVFYERFAVIFELFWHLFLEFDV